MTKNTLCHCCSRLEYEKCCGPILAGKQKAETPEALMRSRYSAFKTQNIDYLLNTTHPNHRTSDDRAALDKTIASTLWLGLKVLHSEFNSGNGTVEFCAFYRDVLPAGKVSKAAVLQLHEVSRFIQVDERWLYSQGQHLPAIKLGRNDLCYCGSGEKLKKCCA